MKNKFYYLGTLLFLMSAGCGTTANKPAPRSEYGEFSSLEDPLEESAEPRPVRQAPILRQNSQDNHKTCSVTQEDDGTQVVISDQKDWFLHVNKSANVDCSNFGGNAIITDGLITVTIKTLTPSSGDEKNMEKLLREEAVKYIRSELKNKYGNGSDLRFKEVKLRPRRPALCANADLSMNAIPGKVVACITSKKNINDEIIVHRTVWTGTVDEYDPKGTFKLVKKTASGWFRYSDTNTMGKITNKW